MERNLSHRIEVCFPILRKKLANRIIDELEAYLNDEVQSWELQSDGEYREITPSSEEATGVQTAFLRSLARIY
jgi:polyphosphate kinase